MCASFWLNIDSINCLLGGLKMKMLVMYVTFWQNIDSVILAYLVRKDFASFKLIDCLIVIVQNVIYAYVQNDFAGLNWADWLLVILNI